MKLRIIVYSPNQLPSLKKDFEFEVGNVLSFRPQHQLEMFFAGHTKIQELGNEDCLRIEVVE